MVFSYYLLKYPYKIAWQLKNTFNTLDNYMFYCADLLDIVIFEQVQKHLKNIPIIAQNRDLKSKLQKENIFSELYPVFPKAVFMCRHACYKFPEDKILKFGFRHGAYHFKKLTNAKNYNAFTAFFVTSKQELLLAKEAGIASCVAVGYPKLDPAFNGVYNQAFLQNLKNLLKLNPQHKTLMFTATWDKSGMSAIKEWIYDIDDYALNYNILVTVHPWMSEEYKQILRNSLKVKFIESPDVVPFLMLADCVIGDTSSILAEACALNKPIITFKVGESKRKLEEIDLLIRDFSWQIESKFAFKEILTHALNNPDEKLSARNKANSLMFDNLDGQAGIRAAEIISQYLPELKL